jgi:hypothetical protein
MPHDIDSISTSVPLILFLGMGADASVFASQKAVFPNLIVPDWPVPLEGENLSSYCGRLAADIDPGCPCFIGGASFGGIVALEMTQHLNSRACFLIGSVRRPQQLPKRIRFLRSLSPALGMIPLKLLQRSASSSVTVSQNVGAKHLAGVSRQFSKSNTEILRWSAKQILKWNSNYENITVRHIHGDCDRVFPIKNVEPDEVIDGGGHVISMTHGHLVNKFLREHIQEISSRYND